MALDGTQLPIGSDNLTPNAAPAKNAGMDNFLANTWSNSQAFNASDAALSKPVAQLFDIPGQSTPFDHPLQLARLLDKGFTSQDVVSIIKEQIGDGKLERNISEVKVVYVEAGQTARNADFRIDKDGRLTMPENKDLLNKNDLVIEVERPAGYIGAPLEAQQKSLNTLVKSLAEHVLDKQGNFDDPQGLIPGAIRNRLHVQPAPEAHFPQAMQKAMHNMQRFAGAGHGEMTSDEANKYFPERQVERLPNESNSQVSLKDAIAGFATASESQPYYAVRNFGDRGLGVGRYMFTAELLLEWLEDLFSGCGKPPDAQKILAKLLKNMKNKELALKCAQTLAKAAQSGELKGFINDLQTGKLKAGSPATIAAIEKFLPKEMQEVVASQLIDKLAQTGSDPNKIAMHMLIGHEPTKEDMSKPEYQMLKDSFERLSAISTVRTDHPSESIGWQDNGGKLECAPLNGRKTSGFGHREHPVTHEHGKFHGGADLALVNDKIPALLDGHVEQAGFAGAAGYKVTINHGRDQFGREMKTVYMHMQPNLQVHAGDYVRKGKLIGLQGSTGRVTGKHLHLGLYMNGKAVNPLDHLNIGIKG